MDKENKLTGIELFEKFGIDSITYDSGNAEDPNIPFSKFDTYNTMIIKYMDGRTEEMKRSYVRRSKRFMMANEVLLELGYTINSSNDGKKSRIFEDYKFEFAHPYYMMPNIGIENNTFHEKLFKITGLWGYSSSSYFEVKNKSDFEKNIFDAIEWYAFKYNDKKVLRDIKIRKVLI